MRRVLIVSPHFPPVNAPDMQRVRLALPYLRALGWEAVVLAVEPDSVEGAVIDPLLAQTYPSDTRVIRVRGLSPRLTRPLGIGSLWWRCRGALRRAGDSLLHRERFDLVFFSTTQFDAFTLGPRWRKRFNVPFIVDYQDPWVNDYYSETHTRPPGGHLKFWFSQFTARRREPAVLRAASGVVSVSAAYGPSLQRRYPWLPSSRVQTIPFGTAPGDLEIARHHPPIAALVPVGDGNFHHVYVGRCGPDMAVALAVLFRAFKSFLTSHPVEAARHRFHFIGTGYAPPPLGRHWVLPVADREGVSSHVCEHCYRVPYFDALHWLSRADALMVIGSDDPTYSASKIFPYLFARRPVITLAHEQSQMIPLAQNQGLRATYGFNAVTSIDALAHKVYRQWFVESGFRQPNQGNLELLSPHTADNMTTLLVGVFNTASGNAPLAQ
ncbi:MAG: hypothetical protein ACAH89_04760 [Rariglobus sp.]|nr:hypothetical protein [Rariglobus sp.]